MYPHFAHVLHAAATLQEAKESIIEVSSRPSTNEKKRSLKRVAKAPNGTRKMKKLKWMTRMTNYTKIHNAPEKKSKNLKSGET